MKHCPYCTNRLPFWNLIKQRLTFSEQKPLVCPACTSIISTQGYASIWPSVSCGAGCGSVVGMLLGDFSGQTLLVGFGVFILVFLIAMYVFAPVRDA